MKKIQSVLFEELNKNEYGKFLLNFGAILIWVSVAVDIINVFTLPSFLQSIITHTSRIIYFAYVMGLIGCFAKNETTPIGIAFGVNALASLINMFRGFFAEYPYFTFTTVVNVVVYGALAFYVFTRMNPVNTTAGTVDTGKKFCSNCGQENQGGVIFCSKCGNRL